MNKEQKPYQPLTIHCISKEESNCPLIPMLIEISQIGKEKLNAGNSFFLPSIVFGKRVVIPRSFLEVDKIKHDDVVELIDYNPVTKTLLYLGPNIPSDDVAAHFLVHHAKKEIQAMMQIKNPLVNNKMKKRIPQVTLDEPVNTLEKAKKWLKVLQKTDVFFSDEYLIITASSIKKIKHILNKLGKEQSEI